MEDTSVRALRVLREVDGIAAMNTRHTDTTALDAWAGRIRGWLDARRQVHVYFDNSAIGTAGQEALRLLARMGMAATARPCQVDDDGVQGIDLKILFLYLLNPCRE